MIIFNVHIGCGWISIVYKLLRRAILYTSIAYELLIIFASELRFKTKCDKINHFMNIIYSQTNGGYIATIDSYFEIHQFLGLYAHDD